MAENWEAVSYVISSRYRVAVLRQLAKTPAAPRSIADSTDIAITNVSRVLRELRERSLVELLVPEERKKGRVYGITDEGMAVWERIQSENLLS